MLPGAGGTAMFPDDLPLEGTRSNASAKRLVSDNMNREKQLEDTAAAPRGIDRKRGPAHQKRGRDRVFYFVGGSGVSSGVLVGVSIA